MSVCFETHGHEDKIWNLWAMPKYDPSTAFKLMMLPDYYFTKVFGLSCFNNHYFWKTAVPHRMISGPKTHATVTPEVHSSNWQYDCAIQIPCQAEFETHYARLLNG